MTSNPGVGARHGAEHGLGASLAALQRPQGGFAALRVAGPALERGHKASRDKGLGAAPFFASGLIGGLVGS